MVAPDTDQNATTDIVAGRPAVFFDGSCPLCTAEISTYRKCRGADEIDWVDVAGGGTGVHSETIAPGLMRTDAMRRFHMRRADGEIVSGGAAFAELWTALPAFSWAGRIGRQRPVALLLEGAYRLFLPVRPLLQKLLRSRAG
jgi:predicted DCC family thiol-disulfide oxidoreductase YuxK